MPDASHDLSQTAPLDAKLVAMLAHAGLRQALRELLDWDVRAAGSALPRRLIGPQAARWLTGRRVLMTLARSPNLGAQLLWLGLLVADGAALSDRVLGGEGGAGVAGDVGALGAAECGVLAYALARCCAAHAEGWTVLDVECPAREPLIERVQGGVVWPLALQAGPHSLPLSVIFPAGAVLPSSRHRLHLGLADQPPTPLPPLSPGDLLAGDGFVLTPTAHGLEGTVALRVDGCAEILDAHLTRGQLQVCGTGSIDPASSLWLTLATRSLTFSALADLASGQPCALPIDGDEQVTVSWQGRDIAQGELVRSEAGIGVRIQRCEA